MRSFPSHARRSKLADARLDFQRTDITSTSNRWVRLARSLHRRRARYRERASLVEGVHPLQEVLATGADVAVVLLSTGVAPDDEPARLAGEFARRGDLVLRVEAGVFERAAETDTPPGILAIAPFPRLPIEIPDSTQPLILLADQVRDPGNLGTLIRSAQGAGAHGVLIGPGCVDPYAPKVIRAAMGSHFHIPLEPIDWESGHPSLANCTVYAADSHATISYDEVNWREPVAIIVGGETEGLSAGALALANATVGIPLAKGLESLNAAIAGSVLLFEAARRRRKGS